MALVSPRPPRPHARAAAHSAQGHTDSERRLDAIMCGAHRHPGQALAMRAPAVALAGSSRERWHCPWRTACALASRIAPTDLSLHFTSLYTTCPTACPFSRSLSLVRPGQRRSEVDGRLRCLYPYVRGPRRLSVVPCALSFYAFIPLASSKHQRLSPRSGVGR